MVSQEQLDADEKHWNALPVTQESFAAPPPDWHRFADSDAASAFSVPCALESLASEKFAEGGLKRKCKVGTRLYIVMRVLVTNPSGAAVRRAAYEMHEGMVRRFEELAVAGKFAARSRVIFAGHAGREESIRMRTASVETRLISGSQSIILMVVSDSHDRMPGDSARFFNALELR